MVQGEVGFCSLSKVTQNIIRHEIVSIYLIELGVGIIKSGDLYEGIVKVLRMD